MLLPEAPTLPVGELIRRIEQTAAALDPEWAQRRAQRAEKNARVILSPNPSGTATLSVCDVAAPAGLAMRDRVDALAAAVRRLGVLTPVSTLRAAVAARLLDGSVAGLDDRVVALVLATEYHGSGPAGQDPEPGDGPADGDGPDPDDDPDTGPDDDPDTGPDDDGGSDDDGGPDDDGLHVPRDGGAAADEHDDHAPVDDGPDEYGPGEDATGEDATGDDSAEADAAATGGAGRPGPARPARSRSARARTTLLAALDPDDHGEWGPCSPSSATGSAVSGCAPACPRPRTPTTWPEGVREPRSAGGSGSATGTASRPAADGPPTTPTSTTPWPAASAGPRCHWNLGVFDRHHHRAKHHAGWRVRQPRPGHFEIRTRARVKHITTPKPIIDPLPRPRPAARPRPLRDDGRHPDAPDDDGTAEDGTADGSTDDRTSDHRPTSAAGRPTARPTATPVGRPEPPATEDATDDPQPF
ncbi:MAG TPA: hypothetical protein VK935_01015 [Actinomycetospora sp.]|nr:hypothetical protein [Actinomycetospora sp.]